MPLILSLFLLTVNVMVVWFAPPAGWLWLPLLANAGALAAFLPVRRAMPAPLRLTATSLIAVFLLNYHFQVFLVDWLYHSPRFDSLWREFSLRRLDGSMESRAETIYAIAAIFGLLCAVLTGYGMSSSRAVFEQARRAVHARVGAQTLWVIFGLGVGGTFVGLIVQVAFGIGALTAEKAFSGRWDGLIYHTLVTFSPLLFMAIHWECLRQGHASLARLSLIAYGGLAVAEMAMMSSRGFVVLQMLPLLLLYLWMGYSPRKLITVGITTILLTVMLYPVVTAVRNLRAISGYGATESIQAALTTDTSGYAGLSTSVIKMCVRFIGYTSYLTSLERPDDRFDWDLLDAERIATLRENGFTRWFTESIAGYGAGIQRHFSSPGLLGAAQVIGGPAFVFAIPPLFAIAAMGLISALANRDWRLGPLVPVNVLASLLFLFEEGVFDLIFTRLMLVGISLVILNWLFRFVVPDVQTTQGALAHGR